MRICATAWSRCRSPFRHCRQRRTPSLSSCSRCEIKTVFLVSAALCTSRAPVNAACQCWRRLPLKVPAHNLEIPVQDLEYQQSLHAGCVASSDMCFLLHTLPPNAATNYGHIAQRDKELAAAVAAAASAREASSLPTSPTGRGLRTNLSGGSHSTGAVTSPMGHLSAVVVPSHAGELRC